MKSHVYWKDIIMKAKIKPSICQGTVKIPPSKSMAHRAIICAALADGKSIISNIDYSVDIQTTIDCQSQRIINYN